MDQNKQTGQYPEAVSTDRANQCQSDTLDMCSDQFHEEGNMCLRFAEEASCKDRRYFSEPV